MNNHNTLFYNIMTFIRDGHISFHDLRIWQTFVWALVGVIQSQPPHFSHWLSFRRGPAKAASKERQFWRWLHNEKIRPMLIYQSFIKQMLRSWCDETAYVALDTTQLWKRFVIVRLALVYSLRPRWRSDSAPTLGNASPLPRPLLRPARPTRPGKG